MRTAPSCGEAADCRPGEPGVSSLPIDSRAGGGPHRATRSGPQAAARAWASIVAASLTSNLPGASTFSVLTTPSATSIE